MKRLFWLSLFACLSLTVWAQQPRRQHALTAREVAAKAFPSVVELLTADASGDLDRQGSGFFVRDNLIATNYHVIKDASVVHARIVGQKNFFTLTRNVWIDADNDLALIEVTGLQGRPLRIGNSNSIRVGDEIYVVGNPKGLDGTFSHGIVSALRARDYIQITAPISHGSSGGPVLNKACEVIGVATSTIEEGQNLNFAVSAAHLSALVADALSNTPPQTIADDVTVSSGSAPGKRQKNSDEPDIVRSFIDAGLHYHSAGQYNEAIQRFKAAIELNPESWTAHYWLGRSYFEGGANHKDVIEEMNICIRLNPNNLEAYRLTANAYSELNQHDPAIYVAKEFARRDSSGSGYVTLGFVLNRAERRYEAVEAYKTAIKINPKDVIAHNNLGLLLNRLGDRKGALNEYQILKNLDPEAAERFFKNLYK